MKFVVEIDLGNEAMQSAGEVVDALSRAVSLRLGGQVYDPLGVGDSGAISDTNGNTVGQWRVEEES